MGEVYFIKIEMKEKIIITLQDLKYIYTIINSSIGPKGLDKMIIKFGTNVLISNDGAFILENLKILIPLRSLLRELACAQDTEFGDGTTSVTILFLSLIYSSLKKFEKNISVMSLCRALTDLFCETNAVINHFMSFKTKIDTCELFIRASKLSISTKNVHSSKNLLSSLVTETVMKLVSKSSTFIEIQNINLFKCIGGFIEDTEIINGVIIDQKKSDEAKELRVNERFSTTYYVDFP